MVVGLGLDFMLGILVRLVSELDISVSWLLGSEWVYVKRPSSEDGISKKKILKLVICNWRSSHLE
jgi:hypothetical protein